MKKTIITALALAASVSVASAYNHGKYDGEFGMSLEGIYGVATEDITPDVAGANLSLFNSIETGSVFHQISLNVGILGGSHHPSPVDAGLLADSLSVRTTYVPMMAGYTFNVPMGDSAAFYLGAKAGFTYCDGKTTAHYATADVVTKGDDTEFSWSAQLGFKFAVSDTTDFFVGYEYMQIHTDEDPGYHMLKIGFSWNF